MQEGTHRAIRAGGDGSASILGRGMDQSMLFAGVRRGLRSLGTELSLQVISRESSGSPSADSTYAISPGVP